MKKIIFRSCSSALVVAAGLLAAAFPAAGQSVLLTINQQNLSAVTITASSATSFANSIKSELDGVDIVNYFVSAPTNGGLVTGNLDPSGSGTIAYNKWFPDNLNATGGANLDMNLFVTNSAANQSFNTGTTAFTGVGTVNLSAASLIGKLPGTGATGNIYSGNILSPGVLIGTWVVVPEPSVKAQLALGATLLVGLVLFRRVRRAGASR
jgi:hypothetical protein